MAKSLTLTRGAQTIDLYQWMKGVDTSGFEAMAGITGFGFPEEVTSWFSGAGDGESFRGARTSARIIEMPVVIKAEDRTKLNERLSELYRMLKPKGTEEPQLNYADEAGDLWRLGVRRIGGGDWERTTKMNNNRTRVSTSLTLKAGNPFWTRVRPENFEVTADASGRGLLPWMAKLELSDSGAFGVKTVNNPGDVTSWPYWTIKGPFTRVILTGANGEVLDWSGTITAGQGLYIEPERSRVVDFTGARRYNGLAPNPKFWGIEPGIATVSVVMTGITTESRVLCEYRPRRAAVA